MPAITKPLSDEEKDYSHRMLLGHMTLGVAIQNINLHADTTLFIAAAGGDVARAAASLAFTSSAAGMVELVFNPILGKMSDDYGRKFIFYVGPVMSGVVMSFLVVVTGGKNEKLMLLNKALNWSLVSMSQSFIGPVAVSDMYEGPELGIRLAKLFGAIGPSVILAPALGSMIMARTGKAVNVYKVRLLMGLIHTAFVWKCVPETLLKSRQRPFQLSDANPLSFLELFRRSGTLRTLAALLFLTACAEGKNIVPLMHTWMNGYPLRWSVNKKTLHSTMFGVAAFLGSAKLAPLLMKRFGGRGFTSITNIANTIAFTMMGLPLPNHDTSFWAGLAMHVPGINNTSSAAMKALATDHAVANGIPRGDYGGMYSSLRSLSLTVAPALFGWAYLKGVPHDKAGPLTFLPWLVVALVAALLPELLHRSLSDADLVVPQKEEPALQKA